MENKQNVAFDTYEMHYKGGVVTSALMLVPFEGKYYERYKTLLDGCFYEMRKALGIRPYAGACDSLEELLGQKGDIFLLVDGDEVIGSVSCHGAEIAKVAVSQNHQRQGYGRKLVEFALHHMQKRGESPIKLTVTKWNEHAIVLYESLGFEKMKKATVAGISARDADGNWRFVLD